MSVLVVDRFTTDRRLPSRQGVGLARKIGADIAPADHRQYHVRQRREVTACSQRSLLGDDRKNIGFQHPLQALERGPRVLQSV